MKNFTRIVSILLVLSMLLPLSLSFVSCNQAEGEREEGYLDSESDELRVDKASQTVKVGNKNLTLREIEALREEAQRNAIDAIKGSIGGDEGAAALEALYSLYGTEAYAWLANLYDPAVGGFYYSNSARDNIGFLPDLESTRQAFAILENSGMTDSWVNLLPAATKADIGAFVSGLLNEDGYYYHPQWGESIPGTRRSRDRMAGNQILKALGLMEASAHSDSSVSLASAKLNSTKSKVVAVASAPEHLASESAFRAYMDGLEEKMAKDSYSTGNNLNAQIDEINGAGYHSILIEYLNKWKNNENGLWESTVTQQSINGLMKISAMYNSVEFNDPYTSLCTLVDFLAAELDENGNLTDEALASISGITSVYNPWVIMEKLYCKSAKFNSGEKEAFAARISELGPKLIRATTEKFRAFKREDGGFSYTKNASSTTMLGVIAAVANTKESDINATSMAISCVREYILPVLGISEANMPDVYTEYDGAYFVKLLEARQPVEKIIDIRKPHTSVFDNYIESDGDTENGVLMYPDAGIKTNVGNTELDSEFNYKWFRSSIVTNPTDASDRVLYAETLVDGSNVANKSSSNDFSMLNAAVDGNTYVFETDLYVSTENTGVIAELFFLCGNNPDQASSKLQLKVVESSSLGGLVKTKSMQIQEAQYNYGSNDNDGSVVKDLKLNTWYNIRFELTKTYTDATLSEMTMKIYVDGTLKKEFITGRYSSGAYKDYTIDAFRFAYYRSVGASFYLDDTYAAKVASGASINDYYPGSTTDDFGCFKDYTVTVQNAKGEPVPGVNLVATNSAGDNKSLTTNSNGLAVFGAVPDDWRVSVVSAPAAYIPGEGSYTFDANREASITLEKAPIAPVAINAATILHADKISMAFRIDSILSEDVASGESNLKVLYRWADEDVWQSAALRTYDTNTDSAVFVTKGVAAYELTRKVIVVAYEGDEEPTVDWLEGSEYRVEYSVAEFLYNKLYRDGYAYSDVATEQVAADCYLTLIEYGRTAQLHLGKNTDSLISDCRVAYTTDPNTTLDGTNTYLFAYPDETLTIKPTYSGTASLNGWTLSYADGSSSTLASAGSVSVTGVVSVSPKTN